MRLFVALPVAPACRDAIAEAIAPLRDGHDGLRWTDPNGWHVTLAFLGELLDPSPAMAAVSEASTEAEPFDMATTQGERFGDRVLLLGIEDDPPQALQSLALRVRTSLADRGVGVTTRRLRPHVTLARKRRDGATVGPRLRDAVHVPRQQWRCGHLDLWQSVLGGGPAHYETVVSCPLGR